MTIHDNKNEKEILFGINNKDIETFMEQKNCMFMTSKKDCINFRIIL